MYKALHGYGLAGVFMCLLDDLSLVHLYRLCLVCY